MAAPRRLIWSVLAAALVTVAAGCSNSGAGHRAQGGAATSTTSVPGRPGASPSTTAPGSVNIYSADGPNHLSPVVKNDPYLIYVPESDG